MGNPLFEIALAILEGPSEETKHRWYVEGLEKRVFWWKVLAAVGWLSLITQTIIYAIIYS